MPRRMAQARPNPAGIAPCPPVDEYLLVFSAQFTRPVLRNICCARTQQQDNGLQPQHVLLRVVESFSGAQQQTAGIPSKLELTSS